MEIISTALLEDLIKTYGYWAMLIGTFLEGETILIIGGFVAYLGYLKLSLVMLIAFIGSFSGDQLYFFIGRLKGPSLLVKYPKLGSRVDKINRAIERYHDLIMLGFRFIYGMRIMTPFVMGLNPKVRTGRFVFLNAIGAVIWSVVISTGGYLFGTAIEVLMKDIRKYEVVAILVIAAIGAAVWFFHKTAKRAGD
jgi:membrane protein DedA with SNARE-associated domain